MNQFYLEGVGPVYLRRSNKAKRVIIRIKSADEVIIVVPSWVPFQTGKKFAIQKKEWIRKHIERFGEKGKLVLIFDEQTLFNTRWHRLEILSDIRDNVGIHINEEVVQITYPSHLEVDQPEIQDAIKYGIIETLRMEAKQYIPGRISKLAEKYGFQYRKLSLKNQKTLWGSCSSVNNININIHVMRLPQHLLDYILVHELTHTVHKNHSVYFWKAVDQCLGNGKAFAAELRNYRIEL
jgi:predicted metal-dependent hydrolase